MSWKPTFVAITDKDFLLYDAAPTCKDEWALPVHSHSILATRFDSQQINYHVNRHCLYCQRCSSFFYPNSKLAILTLYFMTYHMLFVLLIYTLYGHL